MDIFATTTDFLLTVVATFSYLGIFVYFAGLGHLIPIPEEIAYLIVGYLVGEGWFNLGGAIAAMVAGILFTDNLVYFLSRGRLGQWLRQRVGQTILQRYVEAMHAHIFKTMLALRFAIGLRFLGGLVAGLTKVPWWRYGLYDLLIVGAYATILTGLGYRFRDFLIMVVDNVQLARHLIFILLLSGLGIWLAWKFSRRWRAKKRLTIDD